MIIYEWQIGRGPQMSDRPAESKSQSCGQPDLVPDDTLNHGRLLDDPPHLIEGFHVQRYQDAVARSQPHVVPFSDSSSRGSSVRQSACLVRHRIGHDFIHRELRTVLRTFDFKVDLN
jgi:hypothetical protein